MELRQLQALIAIADHGSFSAAALALHTVQSNVSTHVARLERELGVQLVDRQGGVLTDEGTAVVERARRVTAELDAVRSDLAALRNEVVGTVHLGMIGTTARWLVPLLLEALEVTHPSVRLVIGEGTSTTLEPQLAAGAVDAAVVNLPHLSPDLAERPLFDEDLVLVVPAGHPLAGKAEVDITHLDGMRLLLPAPGTTFRTEIDEATAAVGVTLEAQAELDGLRLIASLTLRGLGPAILPATGAAEVRSGDADFARIAVTGLPRRRVGVVTRRRSRPSAAARAVLALLDDVVADNLDASRGLHPPPAR
ncbi:MAG TPA: LysR family transcriptional regulator [Acidimicrobiales bacterium]|nr:LysR family transcriptional regulator [Acidimicrobiales bacterium]